MSLLITILYCTVLYCTPCYRRPPGVGPPRPGVPEPRGDPQLQRGQQPRQQGGVVQAGQGLAPLCTVHHGGCHHVTLERARLPWHRKGLLLDTGDLAASTGRNNTHHSLILDRATSRWAGYSLALQTIHWQLSVFAIPTRVFSWLKRPTSTITFKTQC